MIPTQRANKGRGLELTVIASQRRVLTLDKMATQVVFRRGGATRVIKSPPDFIGTVTGTGRAVCFDAKECAEARGFPIRDWAKRRPLQREWILRHGEAGAVAGLLVECKARGQFLWLDFIDVQILASESSALWTFPRWAVLGDTLHAIDFTKIPGVADGQQALAGRKA